VFNFDGTLAELKGFEVKRNGELQLIKIFQSSVFESFLKGKSLDECYESVAKIANYWLDILYSKAEHMPDYELFELIAEKRTMSRALEDYGAQKSTSISTAKRLAEFLGDEMVKDKGLNCKYVISKKPEGAPVAERAIPIAIFQAEPSVCKHYLKKWLKAQSSSDLEVRNFLDWEYYIERLNGCIQKIITIPAALQGVNNPVLRVAHPDWLLKRLAERNSTLKQKKIDDIFSVRPRQAISAELNDPEVIIADIEDITKSSTSSSKNKPVLITQKTQSSSSSIMDITNSKSSSLKRKHDQIVEPKLNWREILGPAPSLGKSKADIGKWVAYHKRKWKLQIEFRQQSRSKRNRLDTGEAAGEAFRFNAVGRSISDFVQKSANTKLEKPWQILRIAETSSSGVFKMWILADTDLYSVSLRMTRVFYVNQFKPAEKESSLCRKANKHLPRSQTSYSLYEYSIPENLFQKNRNEIMAEFSNSNVEGVYELNVPLVFSSLIRLGCVCSIKKNTKFKDFDTFELNELEPRTDVDYLSASTPKVLYLFIHYK
jgi:DNA polymerase epsilon subunit 1